jgi:hypothetical protein
LINWRVRRTTWPRNERRNALPPRYQITNSIADSEPDDRLPATKPSVARLLYSASEDGVFVILRPVIRTGPLGSGPRGLYGEGELAASLGIVGLDAKAKAFWRGELAGREAELREAIIALLTA